MKNLDADDDDDLNNHHSRKPNFLFFVLVNE